MRTNLSVNINKIALIRNSRGSNVPDLIKFAQDCERFGADGITVHPRPDERHITYNDVPALKAVVTTEFNIEGYPTEKFMKMVLAVCPDQCTLVPDPPGVLTSDTGWEVSANREFLIGIIETLKSHGIRTSLFLDPIDQEVFAAKEVGADRIELYTGTYANNFRLNRQKSIARHIKAAQIAADIGLGINAGHDLNLENLAFYAKSLPRLDEVSIGHAIVADALYYGIANVIGMYRNLLAK